MNNKHKFKIICEPGEKEGGSFDGKTANWLSNEEYVRSVQRRNDRYSEELRDYFGLEDGEPLPID